MKTIETFLRESNAIEGVFDEQSLKDAKKAWTYLRGQRVLTMDVVLKTHKILMKNQSLEEKYKGAFRDCDVWIGGRKGLNPFEVPSATLMWCFESMLASSQVDAKELHVKYEKIHPFADGNGRTGRMFMNWTRIRNGEPVLIIYDKDKQDYYKWFRE